MDPKTQPPFRLSLSKDLRLFGKTDALNEAHIVARNALIYRVLIFGPWREIVNKFYVDTGLADVALKLRYILKRLADILEIEVEDLLHQLEEQFGKDGPTVLRPSYELAAIDIETMQPQVEFLSNVLLEVLAEYEAVTSSNEWRTALSEMSIGFVRDTLKFPWAWLAMDLAEWCMTNIYNVSFFQAVEPEYWTRIVAPVQFSFETLPHESAADALSRLERDYANVRAELRGKLPRGKARQAEVIEQQVEWLFRNRVLGESIRSIANNPGSHSVGERSDIKDGIREAIRLLSIDASLWSDRNDNMKEWQDYLITSINSRGKSIEGN